MNWIKSQSSFTYQGTPVTRHAYTCNTPLGQFKVYESVGGNVFYIHPFIVDNGGLAGFDPDPHGEFGKKKIRCKSLIDGVRKLEQKWSEIKSTINEI